MTRLELGPIRRRVRQAAMWGGNSQITSDLHVVLTELERIGDALDALCDEADAEPLPSKGLLATDTVRAVIRGDQPA
jgi:hypothetical protein